MHHYKSRSRVVQAVQWTGENEEELSNLTNCEFHRLPADKYRIKVEITHNLEKPRMTHITKEWWVIKYETGEIAAISPIEFKFHYEKI